MLSELICESSVRMNTAFLYAILKNVLHLDKMHTYFRKNTINIKSIIWDIYIYIKVKISKIRIDIKVANGIIDKQRYTYLLSDRTYMFLSNNLIGNC